MEKKNMYLAIAVVAIIIIAGLGLALMNNNQSTNPASTVTIKQKGSDTMLELCQLWSEDYHENNTNVNVDISGGGSGVGILALIDNKVDLAQSSRAMTVSEKENMTAAGRTSIEISVAVDGISIILNGANGITSLTMDQLKGLYNGSITNWNQVGGADKTVTLYGRQSTSGTYQYFQEVVLSKGNYSVNMNMLQGNSAIVEAVKGDASAIGYVGIGYAKESTGINILTMSKNSTSGAYSPLNESAVLNGNYPLARYLYLYTNGVPSTDVKNYILWVISATKGQTIAESSGFYAVPQNVMEDDVVKLGNTPTAVTLKQTGSDTMLELCQIWSEDFHSNYSWINVEISGGGSGKGISDFKANTNDMAQASRAMTAQERTDAIAAGRNPVEFKVALDGIAIIVNPANGITSLTMDQLKGLYNGSITNWNQVGGADKTVTLYGRQSTSGTYQYFQEVVLSKGNYSVNMNMLQGNSAIVEAVKTDQSGIGYVGIGYAKESTGINVLNLQRNSTSEAYSPLNDSAVLSFKYDLSRYLYIYTDGAPTGAEKRWLSWILDANKGQKVSAEIGFIGMPAETIAAMKAQLG
jgi:phosphate transport system substrate-binding protein